MVPSSRSKTSSKVGSSTSAWRNDSFMLPAATRSSRISVGDAPNVFPRTIVLMFCTSNRSRYHPIICRSSPSENPMIWVNTAARFRLVASSIRSTPEALDARASTSALYAPSPMTRAIWGNFHLEHPLVDVRGEEGCFLGADAGRHIRIVSALDGEVPHDASPVLPEVGRRLGVHRRGHRTSATSRIESRQTSARSVSYRRSIRWVPSPLSMTMPPTQSIVPPKLVPTAERTALASFSLQ